MPDFDFEHLDDKAFERMTAGLCTEHIARGLRIFGVGTDGGREATFEGKTHYPSQAAPWDGYIVVQCKQKQTKTGATPKEETDWAIGQLDTEMEKYETAKKKRRLPDYFLFVTNARMSAQQDTGGKDRFVARLDYWVNRLQMKGADVWERDKLNSLVDITHSVARRFGMLQVGDLIHQLAQTYLAHQDETATTLSLFLKEELRVDHHVHLAQAGHTNDKQTPLAQVFVDLRAADSITPQRAFLVVKAIQEASNRPLSPTILKEDMESLFAAKRREAELVANTPGEEYQVADTDLELLNLFEQEEEEYEEVGEQENNDTLDSVAYAPPQWLDPSKFVIIGGPGQGKSTLGQHLAQRHRAVLLKNNEAGTLETDISQMLLAVEEAATKSGEGLPTYPRWPFRIILEDFARALINKDAVSVLDYVAFLIRKRTNRPFTQHDAELLLAHAPCFVAFDGLDEVPAVSNRTEVLDAVRRFLSEARNKNADLLVIATTRPQGYYNEFKQFEFKKLTLKLLVREEALAYAEKFVEAKYATDPDRRARIMQRLEAAAQEEAIQRLLRSPLQVTIMAALVDSVGILPRERYVLFERYYEIIYQREQAREGALSEVLAQHRATLEILHDRIGLLLQVEAESAGKKESRISGEQIASMVHDYLVQEGHDSEELAPLKESLLNVALQRLVFIAPLEDNRYGFEVRSLQEFSAARALMRDDYAVIKERLRAIAPIPYWRNTTLFAVGQAFAKQNTPHRDMVMQLCRELDDNDDSLLFRTLAGSRLALDILDDGIVDLQPRYRRQFIDTALNVLRLSHEETALRLLIRYDEPGDERFRKAALAAASSSDAEVPIGLFAVVSAIAMQNERKELKWAMTLLEKHWPQDIDQQRVLVEHVFKYFTWSKWFAQKATEVARASDLDWAATTLTGGEHLSWVRDVTRIRRGREKRVLLAGPAPNFYYYVNHLGLHANRFGLPAEVLDRIEAIQPTNHEWQPFLLGRAFMLNPTPETLADTLEALVHTGSWKPRQEYEGLPWQLVALLEDCTSPEELLHHAQRARAGELGTEQDWMAAEERWAMQPFNVADLVAFSDEEWPYTGKIAEKGIIPMGRFGLMRHIDEENEVGSRLLEAFTQSSSERYRAHIATGLFYVSAIVYNPMEFVSLPTHTIEALANASNWYVTGYAVLGMLPRQLDAIEDAKSLNAIGHRISVLGNPEDGHPVIDHFMPDWVEQLMPLLGGKHRPVREGILRLLATLAIGGANVPVPTLEVEKLSAEGRIAFSTLNLFSASPKLTSTILAQQIIELWRHKHPRTGIHEMPRVVKQLCERKEQALSLVVVDALNYLCASSLIDVRMKVEITESFIGQLQYRTSGLNNPARHKELATEWLSEVLVNQ